jgi:predicted transport protein
LAKATNANSSRASAAKTAKVPKSPPAEPGAAKAGTGDRSFAEWLPLLPPHLSELMASLVGHVLSLGDDVQRKELKLYVAFKRLKNFATVVPQKARLLLYLHVDPDQVQPLPSNGRDVRQQGHWGTGDLELALASQADLDAAKPLILMAYAGRAATAAPGSGNGSL